MQRTITEKVEALMSLVRYWQGSPSGQLSYTDGNVKFEQTEKDGIYVSIGYFPAIRQGVVLLSDEDSAVLEAQVDYLMDSIRGFIYETKNSIKIAPPERVPVIDCSEEIILSIKINDPDFDVNRRYKLVESRSALRYTELQKFDYADKQYLIVCLQPLGFFHKNGSHLIKDATLDNYKTISAAEALVKGWV